MHLRFGTVSIRTLARLAYEMSLQPDGKGAATWLSGPIWWDFYFMVLAHHPRLAKSAPFKPEYEQLHWEKGRSADVAFAAWCDGRTGYPLVDAAMLRLNQTGYKHNRLRMATASFLAKDLGIDWRLGERYFADLLNDFDFPANNGGWQWAASTGYGAQPYSRIFNPVTRSEKFDPDGALSNDIYRSSRTCRQNGFTRGGWPARSGSRNSVHGTGRELSRTDRRPGTGPRVHTGLIRKVSACSHY